jgi:hypothetical protein
MQVELLALREFGFQVDETLFDASEIRWTQTKLMKIRCLIRLSLKLAENFNRLAKNFSRLPTTSAVFQQLQLSFTNFIYASLLYRQLY